MNMQATAPETSDVIMVKTETISAAVSHMTETNGLITEMLKAMPAELAERFINRTMDNSIQCLAIVKSF